jgi:ATP-dependent Zn protease
MPRQQAAKQKPSVHPSDLECTAYHEAGHAVAAIALPRGVKQVSIVPDEERGSLGHCRNSELPSLVRLEYEDSPYLRRSVELECITFCAGGIAETKRRGRRNHTGARADMNNAFELASRLFGDEVGEKYLSYLHARAAQLLERPEHWAAVEYVARELLEHQTITGRHAKELFRQAELDLMPPDVRQSAEKLRPSWAVATKADARERRVAAVERRLRTVETNLLLVAQRYQELNRRKEELRAELARLRGKGRGKAE